MSTASRVRLCDNALSPGQREYHAKPNTARSAERMPIGRLTLELDIPHAQSLKDRRQVTRSLKEKLRHAFNASVAELDEGTVWNRATIGIVAISNSTSYLTGQLQLIDEAAHRICATLSAEVRDSYAELLPEEQFE